MENLRDLLEGSVKRFGKNNAFIVKDENGDHLEISYSKFHEEAEGLAEALISHGFANSRIAIIGKNSYEWFLTTMATQLMGACSVPLDRELKEGELLRSLKRSEAKAVFCDRASESIVRAAVKTGETSVENIYNLYIGENEDIRDLVNEGINLREHQSNEVGKVEIDENDVAFLLFTSGTTSDSKVVMLSQRNIYSDVINTISVEDLRPTDVNLALLPSHHMLGAISQWLMIGVGGCNVYCDGLKHLQKNMQEYGVTLFLVVPLILETMYKKILKTAEKKGLLGRLNALRSVSRALRAVGIRGNRAMFAGVLAAFGGKLRMMFVGGAACDPEAVKGFDDFGVVVLQGYGLTETSPIIAGERPRHRKLGSVGLPLPCNEIIIYNPDDNGIGEVLVKGPNVTQGYYDDEAATAGAFQGGWFHTGDLGYFDSEGYLFLTGRKKNVIVLKNGKNIFPEEIEGMITKLPYAVDNIIVGLPNNGDEKDLVVSLKIEYDPEKFDGKDKNEIRNIIKDDIERINDTMPAYKRIKRIFITDEPMIKTSTGKVRRFKEIELMLKEESEK